MAIKKNKICLDHPKSLLVNDCDCGGEFKVIYRKNKHFLFKETIFLTLYENFTQIFF